MQFSKRVKHNKLWKAKWIMGDKTNNVNELQPATYLRKYFSVEEDIKKATIYQTAHGLYEFWINGERGTDELFKPGFTSYYKRLQYQSYDVTDLIKKGENIWSVIIADGWWRGVTGGDIRNNFGYETAFLGELHLEFENGEKQILVSDESFEYRTGGLLAADMKLGDIFDARIEPESWKCSTIKDSGWKTVNIQTDECNIYENLIPSESVPVKAVEKFEGKSFIDAGNDKDIDFGQNIAGNVEMIFRNTTEGQRITVEYGEDMRDGSFWNENITHGTPIKDLTRFQQTDYICKGSDEETYHSDFSIYGFRYIRIRGYDEAIQDGDFVSNAIYSVCEENGNFICSDEMINQLVNNSRWSQKGNFMDVPTDCPTRERSPWTGDGQIYAKTATWFADVYDFYKKWMKDISAEQCENGKILNIAPNCMMAHNPKEIERILEGNKKYSEAGGANSEDPMVAMMSMLFTPDGGYATDGSAGWGDVAVILPWTMYQVYGNVEILQQQYASAKAWVDYMITNARTKNERWGDQPWYQEEALDDGQYIWDSRYHWGEWLEPDLVDAALANPIDAITKPDPEVPTAFLAYSSSLLAKIAKILEKEDDSKFYGEYSKKVKERYCKYFISDEGIIKAGRQSCHVRALAFELCDGGLAKKVAYQLNKIVEEKDFHLNTGFLSTPMLLNVLSDYGYSESAYKILEQKDSPGWLCSIAAGGTTIPETWGGYETHKDSLNHYSYGAVCDFLFSRVAGIRVDEEQPGYKHFTLQPIPGGSLNFAKAEYKSKYGMIRSEWRKTDNESIRFEFEIPDGTSATIILPSGT
ncbi:MAG: family 78 glycoside hydrolase catalytic domain, partial [Eubacteriales bacterium]|nr:family 78 glycoside hydrolase catalytic domain [Eubacteriales bacterium]